MSIPAIIGFISLLGIATRNGILLVSHYNHLRGEGMPLHESVVQGSLDRLNPILMTALSSALALIPLALGGNLPATKYRARWPKSYSADCSARHCSTDSSFRRST